MSFGELPCGSTGGYVSCEIVLEISPSGASHMTAVLRPFHLAKTSGDFTAEVLDVFRWIIIVGYFCLYKAAKSIFFLHLWSSQAPPL